MTKKKRKVEWENILILLNFIVWIGLATREILPWISYPMAFLNTLWILNRLVNKE